MTKEHVGSGDLNRSLELLWRDVSDRPKPGPKPKLTLAEVVSTAIALADRDGIDALSMRNVAAELGIGTMSLYRYVPGKGELLDLMIDQVQAPHGDPAEMRNWGWREAMEDMAEGIWRLYTEHSWLVHVNQSRPVLGPEAMTGFDIIVGSFDGTGLPDRDKIVIISAVSTLVTGTAREELLWHQAAQQSGMTDEEFWSTQGPYLERAMETGAYPDMAKLDEDAFSTPGIEIMKFALRAMLDGFETLINDHGGLRTPNRSA